MRTSQAVFYALAFFWLDGFAKVHVTGQVTHAVGWLVHGHNQTIDTDMTILNETKRVHEVLGEIRFDNGVGDSKIGTSNRKPFWLARPFGWDSDNIEILISGNSFNPSLDSLDRAIHIFNHLNKVEQEGKDLLRPIIMKATSQKNNALHYEATLLWIDCQERNSMVVFTCRELPYIKWNLSLNENNEIIDFQETNW